MHKEANFIEWDFRDRSYVNDETVAVAAAAECRSIKNYSK